MAKHLSNCLWNLLSRNITLLVSIEIHNFKTKRWFQITYTNVKYPDILMLFSPFRCFTKNTGLYILPSFIAWMYSDSLVAGSAVPSGAHAEAMVKPEGNRQTRGWLGTAYNVLIMIAVISLASLYHDLQNEVNSLKSSIRSQSETKKVCEIFSLLWAWLLPMWIFGRFCSSDCVSYV